MSSQRTSLELRLLCAFNGIAIEQAPKEWQNHVNPWLQAAWKRVVQEARIAIAEESQYDIDDYKATASFQDYLDGK